MKRFSISICVFVMLFSASCSGFATQITSPVPATMKFTFTPTTLPLSATPSPTETHTPLPLTQTPLPVLREPDEIQTKLFDLLQNNGGCQLPCLFGNIPGIVSPQEMKEFFEQFALIKTQDMIVRRATLGNLSGVSFYFPYSEDNYFNMHISAYKRGNQVEVLAMDALLQSRWDPYYAEIMNYYLLPQMLTTYGQPSQILIHTFRDDRQRPDVMAWPFFLTIIYPEQGIYAKYEMSRQTSGDKFIGCPSKSFISIAVWPPRDENIFEDVIRVMNNGGDLGGDKPISDATSMTSEEFYQIFKNPDNTSCIETPIEIWPNP